jgi:hypothetical protein
VDSSTARPGLFERLASKWLDHRHYGHADQGCDDDAHDEDVRKPAIENLDEHGYRYTGYESSEKGTAVEVLIDDLARLRRGKD